MRVETDEELIVVDEEITSLTSLHKAMHGSQMQHLNVAVRCLLYGLSCCC